MTETHKDLIMMHDKQFSTVVPWFRHKGFFYLALFLAQMAEHFKSLVISSTIQESSKIYPVGPQLNIQEKIPTKFSPPEKKLILTLKKPKKVSDSATMVKVKPRKITVSDASVFSSDFDGRRAIVNSIKDALVEKGARKYRRYMIGGALGGGVISAALITAALIPLLATPPGWILGAAAAVVGLGIFIGLQAAHRLYGFDNFFVSLSSGARKHKVRQYVEDEYRLDFHQARSDKTKLNQLIKQVDFIPIQLISEKIYKELSGYFPQNELSRNRNAFSVFIQDRQAMNVLKNLIIFEVSRLNEKYQIEENVFDVNKPYFQAVKNKTFSCAKKQLDHLAYRDFVDLWKAVMETQSQVQDQDSKACCRM